MAALLALNPSARGDVGATFAWPAGRSFLTAEWRNLVMLNYEIDPAVLEPLLPAGTELDCWEGTSLISVVGFQFLKARLKGIAIPLHRSFVEVNLRCYVRRRTPDGWRRGVRFIRELAPRRLVAIVARWCYGENFLAVPMSHRLEGEPGGGTPCRVEYGWFYRHCAGRVAVETASAPCRPAEGSQEEFIVEHYWGYSGAPNGPGLEYAVAHPRWRVSPASSAAFECDAAALYGPRFAEALASRPASAFWVDGSAVRVYPGTRMLGP